MGQENLYHILGITPNASAKEIKAAFRKLAKQYHPDKNQNNFAAENLFKEIKEAYTILSDPKTRTPYDLKIQNSNAVFSANPSYQYIYNTKQNKYKSQKKTEANFKENKLDFSPLIISIIAAFLFLALLIWMKI